MPSVANEELNADEKLVIDHAITEHMGRPGSLLGILESVQAANAHKFLSMETLRYIADETGIPPSRIYSAVTFYALFNLEAQGGNVVSVCRGTACHTRGSRSLMERLCLELGLSKRELGDKPKVDKVALTTPDCKFTIRTVACLGQCALAPVVELNHHILGHVNERTLLREVKAMSEGRA
ncbi:MAG: NAD(P)H-dependent oxidoreductase subunit E [Terracidiphilus sp.]|jgi:NADH-quinone oxidoreductase subunit E